MAYPTDLMTDHGHNRYLVCHQEICLYVILSKHAFCIFICMKKPQDINGLKKNHYLCNRISYPKK